MFTTAENEYIRTLVISNYNENISNYLCKTINEYNNDYDFECYFTNEEITYSNGSYVIKDYTHYKVDNSTSYNATNKLVKDTGDVGTVADSSTEFYYSNTNSLLDITSDLKYNELNNLSYNLTKNDYVLVVLLLVMPIVVGLLHHFFRVD